MIIKKILVSVSLVSIVFLIFYIETSNDNDSWRSYKLELDAWLLVVSIFVFFVYYIFKK